MPTMRAASTPSRNAMMKACSIYEVSYGSRKMTLKINFDANFKDMLGPSERQSVTAQPRVISITWRDWRLEMLLGAGKGRKPRRVLTAVSKTRLPPPTAETVSPPPETPLNARSAGFPAAAPDV